MQFANKTDFNMTLIAQNLDCTGSNSETGAPIQIGDLARLTYTRGVVRASIGGTWTGGVTVELKRGTTVLASSNEQSESGNIEFAVDVSAINGGDNVYIESRVSTPGTGSAVVGAALSVEHPIVIAG